MQHYYLKLSRIRNVQALHVSYYSVVDALVQLKTTDTDALLDSKVRKVKDKLIYSDYIEKKKLKLGYDNNIKMKKKLEFKFRKEKQLSDQLTPTISIALKYLNDENKNTDLQSQSVTYEDNEEDKPEQKPIHMPYADTDKYEIIKTKNFEHIEDLPVGGLNEKFKNLYDKYLEVTKYATENPSDKNAMEISNMYKVRLEDDLSKIPPSWMTDYEIYDDSLQEDIVNTNYGTPNPDLDVSSVPCGGCGALLHCKDPAIPGFLPSELFENRDVSDLKSLTCQRCHFMINYNTCLDVKVATDEYPKLIEKINDNRRAIVILLVDLTDFPCSIWPNLPDLIGHKRHVYVVGNKIDLLPQDSPLFLNNVKDSLTESLAQTGITKTNIKHIGLISAKTGYGIEQLINKLHKVWQCRSDVYLIGCTNAGKSTLFNTLLQSDLCKSKAVDLIQRATTSAWPGTTLNLLKFPILRPSAKRLMKRVQRLQMFQKAEHLEKKLRESEFKVTKNIELITLQNTISHTFKKNLEIDEALKNCVNTGTPTIETKKIGLDETDPAFIDSRWCYDTPGSIQPDQILHYLTTDELLKTLPRKTICPRTFCIQPGHSIFIAGLARLDILESTTFTRCTVFANFELPITICKVEDSMHIYEELLYSEAFIVPLNDPNRLKMWPELKSKDLETIGIGHYESASDVVLSNAGWIAITAEENEKVLLRGWTPNGRGIYLRTPALLPKSVKLRGMRKIGSPAYWLGQRVFCSKKNI